MLIRDDVSHHHLVQCLIHEEVRMAPPNRGPGGLGMLQHPLSTSSIWCSPQTLWVRCCPFTCEQNKAKRLPKVTVRALPTGTDWQFQEPPPQNAPRHCDKVHLTSSPLLTLATLLVWIPIVQMSKLEAARAKLTAWRLYTEVAIVKPGLPSRCRSRAAALHRLSNSASCSLSGC